MEVPWTEESIFDSYDILEETFKTVSSHDIKAAILIPKDLKPGPHPVIYHIHGGFLVTAHGLFAPFFTKWMDRLALQKSAIIVSPDYRLLPSANGVADLLEDMEDCWQWVNLKLSSILQDKAPGHTLDFSQTLLVGGSAGGYCAAQLAFNHPDSFQALAMSYPLLDVKDKLYVEGVGPEDPNVLRFPTQDIPSKQDTLAWIEEKRREPHTRDGFERSPFAVAACHHGIFMSDLFDNKNLNRSEFNPLERLEAGETLPKNIWLMHGDDDSAVPVRGSKKFADILRKKSPQTNLRFDLVPGHDHAFEYDEKNWGSFAPEAIKFVTDAWLDGDETK
ncbi:hypothetical protein FZEAL_884 [Fusarium zealandicum]|uniref:Alpha/beta hydrolase fold-3 domain-containing protein n=1 Tax=Fusarium zealandicum TaxID=1053134 RepID=A0A8H4UU34_9HYPO|nr:hypothetical protein FZEAL_884 [Fusarium zealandicum]